MLGKVKYLFLIFALLFWSTSLDAAAAGKEVKNIILFIGDGMGPEQVRAAGMYLNGEPGTLIFETFPFQGWVTTYSADNAVTDSAAAATAMATGVKVNNRVISMNIPGNGSGLTTILEYYSALGKSTGLVTTTFITHATPAAFAAHEPHRRNFDEIAVDYFTGSRPSLLLGGGGEGVSRELAQTNGYKVVTGKDELDALEPSASLKVSGQFGEGHMPYFDDLPANLPSLSEMTTTAISILQKNRRGFFLMVEGGRIDHGGHANNIKNNVLETIQFHEAVSAAYEWAQSRDDTLIIVTADHETGGLKIVKNNGRGNLPDVTWSTTGHTGINVGIYAYGARGPEIEGIIDNTDIYSVLRIPVYTLDVQSSIESGVEVMVSPADHYGMGSGLTTFTRTYNEWAAITLTAPYTGNGSRFSKWTVNGIDYFNQSIPLAMTRNYTAIAYFTPLPAPDMQVNRQALNFGYAIGGSLPGSQSLTVTNNGGGTLKWAASGAPGWLTLEPSSGTGSGIIEVSLQPAGLRPGNYTAVIDVFNLDSPLQVRQVTVDLRVTNDGGDLPPFGSMDTPLQDSLVSSSIPVTGWALDDVGVEGVEIYRDPAQGENLEDGPVYIGDVYFIEGARPDVEQTYPEHPGNYKAGWGYMLLTNFLPGGSGTFVLHAVARDVNGNRVTLGSKTIVVDNDHAVKPFGAIDTPAMGQTVSGAQFRNQGWVLTPVPNVIPVNGSTIQVFIDSVETGRARYNVYRSDIDALFPGYANSSGALAYFDFNTRFYENGIHTIAWRVTDSAGNVDGVGSRYFNIQNSGETAAPSSVRGNNSYISHDAHRAATGVHNPAPFISSIREPVTYRLDTRSGLRENRVFPDSRGMIRIDLK
jgi:alkaline phosphatase